jgi:hypothetical protein
MSPLATRIYKHLRKRVIAGTASITYRDLAATIGTCARGPYVSSPHFCRSRREPSSGR